MSSSSAKETSPLVTAVASAATILLVAAVAGAAAAVWRPRQDDNDATGAATTTTFGASIGKRATRPGKNDVLLLRPPDGGEEETADHHPSERELLRFSCNDGFIRFHQKLRQPRSIYQRSDRAAIQSILNEIKKHGRFLYQQQHDVNSFLPVSDPAWNSEPVLETLRQGLCQLSYTHSPQQVALERLLHGMETFLHQHSMMVESSSNNHYKLVLAIAYALETSDAVGPTVVWRLLQSPTALAVFGEAAAGKP